MLKIPENARLCWSVGCVAHLYMVGVHCLLKFILSERYWFCRWGYCTFIHLYVWTKRQTVDIQQVSVYNRTPSPIVSVCEEFCCTWKLIY